MSTHQKVQGTITPSLSWWTRGKASASQRLNAYYSWESTKLAFPKPKIRMRRCFWKSHLIWQNVPNRSFITRLSPIQKQQTIDCCYFFYSLRTDFQNRTTVDRWPAFKLSKTLFRKLIRERNIGGNRRKSQWEEINSPSRQCFISIFFFFDWNIACDPIINHNYCFWKIFDQKEIYWLEECKINFIHNERRIDFPAR